IFREVKLPRLPPSVPFSVSGYDRLAPPTSFPREAEPTVSCRARHLSAVGDFVVNFVPRFVDSERPEPFLHHFCTVFRNSPPHALDNGAICPMAHRSTASPVHRNAETLIFPSI